MATGRTSELVQHICKTLLQRDGVGLSDGELLGSFLNWRDEAAFAALVRRHSPMVWGVCRRVLYNHHDAEDAFQATFLVLLRKAASVQPRQMVANWLHGVALRTALKARAMASKRRQREIQLPVMPEPAVAEEHTWHDLQPLLDHELSRLPDKYRAVIVLCDLDGRTRKEAAQQLRVPEGTVAGRLARARALLAKRLTRRGLVLSGASLAFVLSQNLAATCVPASLVSATIKATALFAVGPSAATGVISAQVVSLTEGVLKLMLLTKLKLATAVLLGLAVASVGVMTLAPAQTPSPSSILAQDKAQQKYSARSTEQLGSATLPRLIEHLASPKFAERQAATKELRQIGEPALAPLREAARGNKGLEVRRRAKETVRGILDDTIARMLKEETHEDEVYYRKVAKILERVTDLATERLRADRGANPPGNVPFLTDAYLRLARARKKLGETEAAANAYQQAEYYCKDDRISHEFRREMVPLLMPIWEKAVREKIARDPALKGTAAKHPLVLLHSRSLYASGDYLQSTYSFIYETADESKHFNDVQLQFDNGGQKRTFGVNMVTNQRNTVADLGIVDFNIDPSLTKAADFKERGRDEHDAINGHVYLEKSGRHERQSVLCSVQSCGG